MKSILYIVAAILLIGWAISVFIYSVVGLIHILLVVALLAIVFSFFSSK